VAAGRSFTEESQRPAARGIRHAISQRTSDLWFLAHSPLLRSIAVEAGRSAITGKVASAGGAAVGDATVEGDRHPASHRHASGAFRIDGLPPGACCCR
jgi:hypothetical protein